MTTFRVGQRVKLVKPIRPEFYGLEGCIVSFVYVPKMTGVPFPCDVQVLWKGQSGWLNDNTSRLEPILPEGHQPSTYSFKELMDECREGVAV